MSATEITSAHEVLQFWFDSTPQNEAELMNLVKRWFQGGSAFDEEVVRRFGPTVEAALRGELDNWASTTKGRLALVLVLDQFTRNVFRGDPRTYAGDAKAQALALEAIDAGIDRELQYVENLFLSMPLLHSENLELHQKLAEFQQRFAGTIPPLYARMHQMNLEQSAKYNDIIRRFGRFPHRNQLLGRQSTEDEVGFLRDWAEKMAPQGMQPSKG